MAIFTISAKSRTFSTLQDLNTAKDDETLSEGDGWRLTWITDTGGTDSVVGIISGGELDPHPLKTGFLPSRVLGEGTKGYTIIDATRVSVDSLGDIVISHGPLTAAGDFIRVLTIGGLAINRNVDKIITIWDVVLTTPTDDMGIFQRIEGSATPANWGQAGILRTGGSWVSDIRRSDSSSAQADSSTPGTNFRVEMKLVHGTGSTVATSPNAQAITGDVGSEGAPAGPLTLTNITDWDTTADERIAFATLDDTGGGVATFTLKQIWVVPNDDSLGLVEGGSAIAEYTTYANLPGSASDGDLARVTTTEAYGLYVYKATVGGDAFGMWLPDQYGSRINDYIRDGSGNPCKISTSSGLGSDTVSAITSRGWTENSAEATNIEITDIGGDIDLDSTTGHGSLWPTLRFTHDTLFADGTYLLVMEMDAITTPGTGSHAGSWVIVADGVTSARLSFSYANVADDISWVNTWNVDAGEGYFTQTAYTRVFALLPVEATTTGSALYSLWDSANGQTNTDTLVTATKPEFKSVAAKNVEFQVAPQSGHNSRVRELHLFKLD